MIVIYLGAQLNYYIKIDLISSNLRFYSFLLYLFSYDHFCAIYKPWQGIV